VPFFSVYGSDTTSDGTRAIESQLYSDRYFLAFKDVPEEFFSHYPLLARNVADSAVYPDQAQDHYEFVCRIVRGFATTCTKGVDSSSEYLKGVIATASGSLNTSTLDIQPAIKPPPTEDQFTSIINTRGVTEAVRIYEEFKVSQPELRFFREGPMNMLGYRFLQRGQTEDAAQLFKMNAETYPTSTNCWDSYGDAALAANDTSLVLMCARKVLEVMPDDPALNDQFREILRTNAETRINDMTQPADSSATEEE